MRDDRTMTGIGAVLFHGAALLLGAYFVFAAVRGDYGLFKRVEVEAQVRDLTAERDALARELEAARVRAAALSDHALDLDLLDTQLRDRLGYMRADELRLR